MIYETARHLSPAPHTDASPVLGTDANGNTETTALGTPSPFRQPDDGIAGFLARGGVIAPFEEPTPSTDPADYRLTKRQIERALILSGTTLDPTAFMHTIIGAIPDATDKALALTDWSTAPYYVRSHPLFADSDVLSAAGMTPAVIDALWMLAKEQPA